MLIAIKEIIGKGYKRCVHVWTTTDPKEGIDAADAGLEVIEVTNKQVESSETLMEAFNENKDD